MLDIETWFIFFAAALALAFAPGPGMLYVLSRTISGGRSAGIASTFGAAVGGSIHVFGAAIGLSTLLATSALAFAFVKYLGAVFLIYLGLKLIYSGFRYEGMDLKFTETQKKQNTRSAFYQGILSELLNPKTAIFFLAFIPQFVRPSDGYVFGQFVLLGIIVVLLNSIPDFLIAFFSQPIEKLWASSKKFRVAQQLSSGICLIGLGAYLALSGNSRDSLASK